jgi:hypothetical protein
MLTRFAERFEKIILHREADLTLKTIRQFVNEAKRAKIGSNELEEMLERASVAISEGDFSRVHTIELSAKQAVKNLKLFDTLTGGDVGIIDKDREEAFMSLIKEEMADAKAIIENARISGIDITDAETLVGRTEEAVAAGDFKTSLELARKVKKLMHVENSGFQAADLKKKMEEIVSNMEEAKSIGIDVTEAEALTGQTAHGGVTGELVKRAAAVFNEAVKTGNAGRHPRLKISIHSDGFEAQKWGRASVELNNTGNSIAKNVDVRFFGDVDVKGWETIPKILPGQKDSRDVMLKPIKAGKVALDMTVGYEKSFDNTKFQLNDLKNLDVSEPGTFLVEDAFLIHNNGLLIAKQTRRIREDVDGDVFSGMLTAISSFAKDSFKTEEKVALSRLDFGENQILIERGRCIFLAVTILGDESIYMPFYISEIVSEIEERYGDILENWDGDMNQLEGVEDIVKKILFVKNTESGTPHLETSMLQPVFKAMEKGVRIPDFDMKMKTLLTSFEEELISGEMDDSMELLEKIRDTVEESLASASDSGGDEERKRDRLLVESMRYEIETMRRKLDRTAEKGADTAGEEARLKESMELLDTRDYERAREVLRDIKESLSEKDRSIAAASLSGNLEELRGTLSVASKMGVDISDVEGMVGDAERSLASGDVNGLDEKFHDMRDTLNRKTVDFMANKHPKLHVNVKDARGHEAGSWSRMEVVVTNRGNTPARNIDLNFAGEVDVRGLDPLDILAPNSSRNVVFSVKPARDGTLPLDVSATYQRYFDETKYQLDDVKDLEAHAPGSYIIEDAFLIHNNGLLIANETRRIKEELDGDLFSAMLKALTDFVRQAFNISRKGGLDRMEFGGQKLLIEKGRFVFLAITITGEESEFIPLYMSELVREIEEKYSASLDDWNGEMAPLEGIEDVLKKMIFVKKAGIEGPPILESSILAPFLKIASEGGVERAQLDEIKSNVARINIAIEQEGLEAAAGYLTEMSTLVKRLTSAPGTGDGAGRVIDAESLKKRMYDIMIRSGHVDMDSTLMDARLNNYLEVVGKIADAAFALRESCGIPADQKLARVVVKHPDHERWNEVLVNMRSLILEQTNAVDVKIMKPDDIWEGLVPDIKIDEEHIRNSYKHIAGKIISVLQYMPPVKLLANIKKGTFTIGVEGQQVYINSDMVSVTFSLPPGAFEGTLDNGILYIDRVITEEVKTEMSLNSLIGKINEMRHELEMGEEAQIEVQVLAGDELAERLEMAKEEIIKACGAYEVEFPLDDPFGSGDYYVGEMELDGEKCRIGIVQVEFDE